MEAAELPSEGMASAEGEGGLVCAFPLADREREPASLSYSGDVHSA